MHRLLESFHMITKACSKAISGGENKQVSAAKDHFIFVQYMDTPLGVMLAAAITAGVFFLEFADRSMQDYNYKQIQKCFNMNMASVTNKQLEQLREELDSYFRGGLKEFSVPLAARGTPFQERVWRELQSIPFGEKISYQELAVRSGDANAVRAVARACAMNRIGILVPCHRVVGKDGQLTGYAGGLWRKRLLLKLERTGRLPGDNAI